MAYIKINDENKTQFRLYNNPEENNGGNEYWYLKLSIICNLPAEEFSEVFIPKNLEIIKMIDEQNQEVSFIGYEKIISVRRTYDKEDITIRVVNLVLQKKLGNDESEVTTDVID